MRVAVFRAAEDGARTAARLSELGHAAVLAPVISIARTAEPLAAGDADAIVFTSAHALEVLHGDSALPGLRRLPCWCVGARTAAAARALGFTNVESGPGDAAQLAATLEARAPAGPQLLLALGRDRKPTLEDRLRAAGFPVRIAEVYHAAAVPAWSGTVVEGLRSCEAALHYSRRSAELAVALAAKHGISEALQAWRHHCLSSDVAEALGPLHLPRLTCAEAPDEPSLLESLEA